MSTFPRRMRDRIEEHRRKKERGEWKPRNLAIRNEVEVQSENGRELLSHAGAQWLHSLCRAMVDIGMVQEASFEGDPVVLWVRNLEGGLSRCVLPNEAINARDTWWILLKLVGPARAQYMMAQGKELTTR